MATFKFISKQNRKGPNSTGGIPNRGLPKIASRARTNVDGGIPSRHAGTASSGNADAKRAVGDWDQQVARLAVGHRAIGQVTDSGGKYRMGKASGGVMLGKNTGGEYNSTHGALPEGSAFTRANVRVSAEGKTPHPPKMDEAPQIVSQKTKPKALTRGSVDKPNDRGGGYTGSFNSNAVGSTGSGIGGRKKKSFK